ncbi:MAG: 2-C-methyl-D-erythritol 4-phosphate cytidylyltransferase [Edaphocola sp.]
MDMAKNTTAIIVAGGKGLRMGNAVPKQFLPLAGKPILYYGVQKFMEVFPSIKIILVLPQAHISHANTLLQALAQHPHITIVHGGETRFHSVQNGLAQVADDDIVFIHDGVRPFISEDLLLRCYRDTLAHGDAIPAIKVTDSTRRWNGTYFEPIDRELLRSVQTPQTFLAANIKKAYSLPYSESFTDEASVWEAYGFTVHLTEGDKDNIKITTPEDMAMAEVLLQQLKPTNSVIQP